MIVVCGEALMDVFALGATPAGAALDARVGGSPFNVAVGLARLGWPVAFYGGLSNGFLGDRLSAALEAEGVSLEAVVRTDAPTTLALVCFDANGGPDYAFYGEAAADRRLTPETLDRVPPAAAFHFGSYSMIVEPAATTLAMLARRECARALVSWDPNVRLNVEPDVGRWRALFADMMPVCHLLKVSDEDLRLLLPGVDPADLVAEWLAAGVRLVVVTRGGAGVSAWTRAGRIDRPAQPVAVVDTVGAGDSFQAALLAGLDERDLLSIEALDRLTPSELDPVLAFAAAAAALTCSRRGADLPRWADGSWKL